MQTTTQAADSAHKTLKAGFQPRPEQPVYRIRATESINDLFRVSDDDAVLNNDWTDALLLD